jgi:hypothetical protein
MSCRGVAGNGEGGRRRTTPRPVRRQAGHERAIEAKTDREPREDAEATANGLAQISLSSVTFFQVVALSSAVCRFHTLNTLPDSILALQFS